MNKKIERMQQSKMFTDEQVRHGREMAQRVREATRLFEPIVRHCHVVPREGTPFTRHR